MFKPPDRLGSEAWALTCFNVSPSCLPCFVLSASILASRHKTGASIPHRVQEIPGLESLMTGDAQVGTYEQDPEALARVLQRWIQHPNDELAELKANAARLGQQFAGGLFRIVRDLAALADQAGHAAAPAFLKYLPPGAFLDAAPALEATG